MPTSPLSNLEKQKQEIFVMIAVISEKHQKEIKAYKDERGTSIPASGYENLLLREFFLATGATCTETIEICDRITEAGMTQATDTMAFSRIRFAVVEDTTLQVMRNPRLRSIVALQMQFNELNAQLQALDD